MPLRRPRIQFGEQRARGDLPARKYRLAIDHRALAYYLGLDSGAINRDGARAWIDHPQQLDAGVKVLATFARHLAIGVAWAQNFNDKVRDEIVNRFGRESVRSAIVRQATDPKRRRKHPAPALCRQTIGSAHRHR
jgi:hypothetical protein